MTENEIGTLVVDRAVKLHMELGPPIQSESRKK